MNPAADPATGAPPVIELREVCVDFGTRAAGLFRRQRLRAVDRVSFAVHRGRTLGIVGESGSGKSTAAKVLIGLIEPSEGQVVFAGEAVRRFDAATRRRLGRVVSVVFQDPATALNARMLVRDALTDPLEVHGIGTAAGRRARVSELVSLVGLPQSVLDAIPAQLSGGQRQRVAIARALALEPEVVVADEPTSALDVSVRAQILNLLLDLKRELDLGMVFISHDIQTVRHVSDDIAVMRHGRVVEFGPGARVLDSPSQDYTRTLLEAAPSLLHPPRSSHTPPTQNRNPDHHG
ncbi:MAG: ABC transporter ATP-binding protein [Rhodobacteraceae bacterium]|nr:ABC transporter ATP-binding protein [Paracoccaceae bacterium]